MRRATISSLPDAAREILDELVGAHLQARQLQAEARSSLAITLWSVLAELPCGSVTGPAACLVHSAVQNQLQVLEGFDDLEALRDARDKGRLEEVEPEDLYALSRGLILQPEKFGASAEGVAAATCVALHEGDLVAASGGLLWLRVVDAPCVTRLHDRFIEQATAYLTVINRCFPQREVSTVLDWMSTEPAGDKLAFQG